MSKDFLVAGCTGLVGSALMDHFKLNEISAIGLSTKDVDFRNYDATLELFEKIKPRVVIDAAARVGGIKHNQSFPVEFLLDNLRIQNNLMEVSHKTGVEKFIFLGSSCIYPRLASQPIKEEYLMSGELEKTNSAYAVAKIAGIELVKSYRNEYGHNWISLMPTNIYGPRDNFDPERAHVIPALIRRFIAAVQEGSEFVEVWGTGTPRREFLFAQDLADAIVFCSNSYDSEIHLNVGMGNDISIRELAELIGDIVDFRGEIRFNHLFPDGTPQKLLDVSKINELGWRAKTCLKDGLDKTVDWYIKNQRASIVNG